LELIVIHSSDVVVESNAFRFCDNLKQCVFTAGKPSDWGNYLFEEIGAAPNGKSYISGSHDHSGETIPYPTLYYTAAYADEWAPNGETEWNGYAIQQISQEELDAILAEARGETTPEVSSSTDLRAALQAKTKLAGVVKAEIAPAMGIEGILLTVIGIAAIAVAVVLVIRLRKRK
jgi:hypothetical protein